MLRLQANKMSLANVSQREASQWQRKGRLYQRQPCGFSNLSCQVEYSLQISSLGNDRERFFYFSIFWLNFCQLCLLFQPVLAFYCFLFVYFVQEPFFFFSVHFRFTQIIIFLLNLKKFYIFLCLCSCHRLTESSSTCESIFMRVYFPLMQLKSWCRNCNTGFLPLYI